MDKRKVAAELVKLAKRLNGGGSALDELDRELSIAARFLRKQNPNDAIDAVMRAGKAANRLRAERMRAIGALDEYDVNVGNALTWLKNMPEELDEQAKKSITRLLTKAVINGNNVRKDLYL